MSIKKNIFLLILFTVLSSFSLYAQEICDNGIDDDGDGLVDINDPDCACSGIVTQPSSLIPNPSFEDHSCCPSEASGTGGLLSNPDFLSDCANTWIQAQSNGATADYFNTCDYTGPAPLPFPDGDAAVGFIAYQADGSEYIEYIAAALSSPLVNGTEYQLEFEMSFTFTDNAVENIPNPLPPNPTCPIDIKLYGTPNASDIPWPGQDCPEGVGGFVEIGSLTYNPDATAGWGTVNITFTPTFDVYAIALGGPCNVPLGCGYDGSGTTDEIPYFIVDNLILNESNAFSTSISKSGDLCTDDLVLTATAPGSGTFQWYKEGVAIVGQTNPSLNVSTLSGTPGNYQVLYSEGGGCDTANILIQLNTVSASLLQDATICSGETASLTAGGGDTYAWSNSLPAGNTNTVSPTASTRYYVTVSNTSGCTDTASALITVNPIPVINIIGDSIFCAGDSSLLDANVSNATYFWGPTTEITQSIMVHSAGTYTVTVTNSYNCSSIDQVNVIVNPNPTPTITGNSVICPTLSTILDAGSGYSDYIWSNASTTQSSEYFTAGMSYVTVTDANSCKGIDSLELSVSPQIVPNVTANSNFVCIGNQVQLSATGAGPSGTYNWDNGLGMGQIQNTTVLGTVDYFVTLTDAHNCSEIGSITITGIDVPVLGINPDDTTICKGSSLNISANGATSYSWFPSYGLSSNVGSVVVASPEVSTVYSITGSNEMGGTVCSSTIQSDITVDKYTFSLPVDKTVCKGTEENISANISEGVAPYFYSWTINNIPRQETVASIIDTINGDRNYTLTGVDGNGCSVTKSAIYKNYPELIMDPYLNKDTACPNTPVLFNASISGGTGEPYQFTFDGHYSNTILTIYPKETYVYQLTVRDGCEEIKDSITIHTYPIPYLDFVADEYGGCVPKEIKFSSISSPAGLIDKYRWNFGDNDNNNLSLSASPLHIYNTHGDYNVTLQVLTTDGCFTDTTKMDLIHIEPKPVPSFKAQPSTVSILKPIIYFNNLSENVDSLSYIWNFGTGDLSNLKSPEYTYKGVGIYEVELIAFTHYGCSDTTYKFVEVKPEVKFYVPDAFSPDGDNHNEVFLPVGTNILNKGYHFYIYDRWGEPIFETDNLHEGWDGKVNGNYVKPGIYAYYIIYKDIYDIKYERAGTVNVIR